MKRKVIELLIKIIVLILSLLSIILFFGLNWVKSNIGIVSIDEIIFHINVPLTGTSQTMIEDIIFSSAIPAILLYIGLFWLIIRKYKYTFMIDISIFKKKFNIKLNKIRILLILLMFNIIYIFFMSKEIDSKFHIKDYIKAQNLNSTFIEENYIDAKKVSLKFPNKKRNLIYIYLESMEATYSSKENGGNQNIDIIPDLTSLAINNTNFSDKTLLGGAKQVTGTWWTIAGMVAHSSGIPLKIPIDRNDYMGYNQFLPGVYNLGDILNDNGYKQMVLFGTDSKFAGRDTFFKVHGNYIIKDYYTAIEEGIIEKDHNVFWGLEDSILFSWAKKELLELSETQEPFNLTLLTVNTHCPGYTETDCENKFGDNLYANSISCSSKQIAEFVDWIKQQDFYENTTIVLAGDHLSMSADPIVEDDDYTRTTLNIFINSALEKRNNVNREFSTLDLFPTTLASLGVEIENNKLGLGTNLYSDEKTIVEKYGFDKVNEELAKKSIFYYNKLLY